MQFYLGLLDFCNSHQPLIALKFAAFVCVLDKSYACTTKRLNAIGFRNIKALQSIDFKVYFIRIAFCKIRYFILNFMECRCKIGLMYLRHLLCELKLYQLLNMTDFNSHKYLHYSIETRNRNINLNDKFPKMLNPRSRCFHTYVPACLG